MSSLSVVSSRLKEDLAEAVGEKVTRSKRDEEEELLLDSVIRLQRNKSRLTSH
jgi:hypothetical protein